MIVLSMVLTGTACIVAVFTFAKHSTWCLILVAFTIVFYTVRFSAFTSFFHLLQFKAQTKSKRFLLRILFLLFRMILCIKSMRSSRQRLNNGLFMLSYILLMISTIITVAMLVTEYFLLETFTIQFETFWSFAITTNFSLCDHVVLLLVHRWWEKTGITSFTTLRKGWRTVANGVLDWEAFVDTFFEGFSEGFWVDGVFCIDGLSITLRIFPGALVFHLWGYESLIGAGAIEYFCEIIGLKEALFGLIT